jgi:RHS repeat-associated protein
VTDAAPGCGASWTNSNYSGNDTFNAVIYGGGKFVAVGNNGVIKTSSDGISWTSRTSNTSSDLHGVDYGFSTFVAVGENGTVLTSTNAVSWTLQTTGTNNTLYSVIYGLDKFIVVGISGTILTSDDGVNWADSSCNISQTFYGVVYGNGIFVVVGGGGVVFTSIDGANWTQRSSGTSQTLRGVTFGDNQFVAVGGNGVILTGTNGINWASRISSINVDLFDAAYGNGFYVAVGNSGKILTSSDGVYWDSQSSGVRGNLSGVVFGNSRFVAVGAGEIIYSMCEQAAAASVLNNKKFLEVRNPFFKKVFGRRRQSNNDMTDRKVSLQLLSPNGDEVIQTGEKFLITWESDKEVEKVKLEYSPDNGTTYLPIAVDVHNTGHYEWVVPHHISSNCLIRVSESRERKMPPHGYLYETDFRVNGAELSAASGETFSIHLGDAADQTINQTLSKISFRNEANGKAYIQLNDSIVEIGQALAFQDKWHNIQVFMDNVYDCISVIMDGSLVFENIPKTQSPRFSPAISFSMESNNSGSIEIDDVVVKAFYSTEDNVQWLTLFNEDFERLNEENSLANTGWRTKSERNLGNYSKNAGKGAFVYFNPASELKTLTIQPGEGHRITVVKSFHVPVDFPFDVSDKTFEIRYNDDMYDAAGYDQIDGFPGHGGSGASANNFYSSSSNTLNNSIPGRSRTSELINTYYIYTFDGKLLAEYDHSGNCVRDYIYAGNRLIAEYKPQTNEYFYYITDQINSTRIITDGSGNVVFSEAAGPYGDVQKTWTNTYDPKMKFSGKEREGYSDLDYFGARYFDHKSYRFNSVDPIINKEEALFDPQLWNLYAFCGNSPITFFDPTGKILEVTGGKSEIKDFKKFVYDNTGYNVDVKKGQVSISGNRNKNVGNSTAAKYFEEAVTMKQTIKFDLMSKQRFLIDKWVVTGHALVDIGDLTSSQKSAGVIFSAGAFIHILSEQIFATKNNAGYVKSHAHAESVVNALRGAARRTFMVTGNNITFDFWDKGGRKIASFSFKLDKNLTPY